MHQIVHYAAQDVKTPSDCSTAQSMQFEMSSMGLPKSENPHSSNLKQWRGVTRTAVSKAPGSWSQNGSFAEPKKIIN